MPNIEIVGLRRRDINKQGLVKRILKILKKEFPEKTYDNMDVSIHYRTLVVKLSDDETDTLDVTSPCITVYSDNPEDEIIVLALNNELKMNVRFAFITKFLEGDSSSG